MSYLVFARKYRPQSFDEVIGQQHVTKTLQNAIKLNRIHHAYLLSGPRGTGKTTTARILAKALNCEKGPTPEPCNKCKNCESITKGNALDVIEIDAASNRGIDDIKEFRETVKFAPTHFKYKVYIIDEAHQITKDAFNVLLKTLEEPPEYVVFVFCTTEVQKFPDTILSRCQQFNFRLATIPEIKSLLEEILKKEKIKFEEKAVELIARAGEGSLRDSLSILDQIASFTKDIKKDDVVYILGLIPEEEIKDFVFILKKGDKKKLLLKLDEIIQKGWRLDRLIDQLIDFFRLILKYKFGFLESILTDTRKDVMNLSKKFEEREIIWMIEVLSQTKNRIRWSKNPINIVELNLLKIASGYIPVDEVIKSLKEEREKLSVVEEIVEKNDRNIKENEKKLTHDEIWNTFMTRLKKEKITLYNFIKEAKKNFNQKEKIMIMEFPANFNYQKEYTEKNIDSLKNLWKEISGEDIEFITSIKEAKEESIKRENRRVSLKKIKEEEPAIKEIEDEIGGFLSDTIDD